VFEILGRTVECSPAVVHFDPGEYRKLVDQVIIAAYRKNASDIHIEPSPVTKATTIRFRLDGVCQEYMKVPNSIVRGIISRIKIMSNLDIAEKRLPQDGKIKFRRKGVPAFELRVATLPTAGGFEDVVMRILASAGAMKIDKMGLTERNLKVLKAVSANPYGLVLAVGPTGSGKTWIAEQAIARIRKRGGKAWYASPLKALSNGKYAEFSARFGSQNVGILTGDRQAFRKALRVAVRRD